MKKNSILIATFVLSVALGQAQTPSGKSASPSGKSAAPSGFSTTSPQQQSVIPPNAVGGNRATVDVQNRPGFGGTNQVSFGATNRPAFGATNQIAFGGTNGQVPFATNVGPSAIANATNNLVVTDPSGATRQSGVAGQTAADQAFAQRLQVALARTGATQVFFPQTRSTIQVMNQNGTIVLQGVVTSQTEKQNIEAQVRAMQGVSAIDNQLQISANTLPQNPVTPGTDRRLLTP